MTKRVAVVDYGLGNLHSVLKALAHVGATVSLAEDAAAAADRLVLPGVGAFADGMRGLEARGQAAAIRAHAASGRPLLGICLGMQMLFDASEEFGEHAGLGLVPGRVVRIQAGGAKVPHIGWQRLRRPASSAWAGSPLAATAEGAWAYFVHSYHALPRDAGHLLAQVAHGPALVTAAVRSGAVTGFQFHPEKSGPVGLDMLATFIAD